MPSSMLISMARKCCADERALKNRTIAKVTPPMRLDTISIVRMNLLRSEPRGAGGAFEIGSSLMLTVQDSVHLSKSVEPQRKTLADLRQIQGRGRRNGELRFSVGWQRPAVVG